MVFKSTKFILSILLVLFFSHSCNTKIENANNIKRVIAYYSNFVNERPVETIFYDGLTHINHAFLYIDSVEIIKEKKLSALDTNNTIQKLITTSKLQGVKVLISITGRSDHFFNIASNIGKTDSLINFVTQFCIKKGYLGVDLDWETPIEEEKDIYISFVKLFYQKLHSNGLTFSVTLPGQYHKTSWLKYIELIKHMDWINLMTYDYGNGNKSIIIPNTPLQLIQADIDSFLTIIPPHKIVMGCASYGYLYENALGYNIGDSANRIVDRIKVDIISKMITSVDWQYKFLTDYNTPVIYNTNTRHLITYDNDSSIIMKCDLAKSRNLSGIMFWNIFYDSRKYANSIQSSIVNEYTLLHTR